MKKYILFFWILLVSLSSCKKDRVLDGLEVYKSISPNIGTFGPSASREVCTYWMVNNSFRTIMIQSVSLHVPDGSAFSQISYRFFNEQNWNTLQDDLTLVFNKPLAPGQSTVPFIVKMTTLSAANGYVSKAKTVLKIRTISTDVGDKVPKETEVYLIL